VETFLVVMVLMGLVNMLSDFPEKAEGLFQFIFFGFILLLEKLYSVYHAKHYVKEFIPMEKDVRPLKVG